MSEETSATPIADPSVTVESSQPVEALPEGMVQLPNGSVQVLSTSAFKRIKEQAMQRGKRDYESSINEKLKSLGFSSFDELVSSLYQQKTTAKPAQKNMQMSEEDEEFADLDEELANLQELQANPPQKQQAQIQPKKNEGQMAKNNQSANAPKQQATLDREKQLLRQQADRARQRMIEESRRRKELQRSLEAKEAEMAIRETAIQCGVRDIDYAVNLLARNLEAKSEEELAAFDEKNFFSGLRNTHPYLFGEVARPATTGPGVGIQPAPLKPATVSQTTAQNAQTDARKMDRQEFESYLRSKGLSSPFSSVGEL